MPDLNQNAIKEKIQRAANILLKHDSLLLELDVNERSITHKFAEYLQAEFPEWHVDCEYNRRGHVPKMLHLDGEQVRVDDTNAKTVYPDIIVHHRNTNDNLLVIEVKKSSNPDQGDWDQRKLAAFRDDDDYQYTYAMFLKFETRRNEKPDILELRFVEEHS